MSTLKFTDQNIFFTADTHYHHPNIVGPSVSSWQSGFRNFDSMEQMDNTIVSNMNELISENDILFHLGDFAWGDRNVEWFRKRIHCKNIYLILGNHDKEIRRRQKLQTLFTKVFDFGVEIEINNTRIVLCHYSMKVWNQWHNGSIHLYGHSHGKLPGVGRSKDIGMDTNNFYPYSYLQIFQEMENIPIIIGNSQEEIE
jgi:calcineurin-like phosphoesterase family protein